MYGCLYNPDNNPTISYTGHGSDASHAVIIPFAIQGPTNNVTYSSNAIVAAITDTIRVTANIQVHCTTALPFVEPVYYIAIGRNGNNSFINGKALSSYSGNTTTDNATITLDIITTCTAGDTFALYFADLSNPSFTLNYYLTYSSLTIESAEGNAAGATGTIPISAPGSITTPVSGKNAFYNANNSYALSTKDPSGTVQAYQTQIVINVMDYPWSFDNTGITANDSKMDALRAYIVASGKGAIIWFPTGQYLFHNTIAKFPTGCNFQGASGVYTQIQCDGYGDGYGVFWYAGNESAFSDLYFTSKYVGSFSAAPAQDAVITNATNASPIQITTQDPHNYLTGDKVGIYGVKGNTAANCDPATPWTITVIDGHNYTLNGSTGNGAYTSATVNISNVSNTSFGPYPSINKITTSTPHGLLGGQLMYIAGVTGTGGLPANVNGAERMIGIPIDATNFIIGRNVINNVQVFVGAYTSGGTVFTGGVSVSYSRNPQVGISVGEFGDVGNVGNVNFNRCFFDGFKHGISLDGAEACFIDQCQFGLYNFGTGYNADMASDDSTHTSTGIRLGAFQTYHGLGLQNANFNYITHCNFFNHHVATYHHDGVQQTVSQCNYECPVMCILDSACISITYQQCENDGNFSDSRGLIQVRRDLGIGGTPCYGLAVRDCALSGNGAMVYGDGSEVCFGLECTNNVWLGAGNLVLSQATFQEPFTIRQNDLQASATMTDGLGGQPNSIPGKSIFNGGTTINHYANPTAALDVAFYPYNGLAPATSPAFLIRSPHGAEYNFSVKEWSTTSAYWGGSFQEYDNIISATSGATTGARKATSLGWILVSGGAINPYNIGALEIPENFGSGVITVTVQANVSSTESLNSFWKFRQRYYQAGVSITLGPLDEMESYDGIGLTTPILVLTGAFGSTVAKCTVYSDITGGVYVDYAVKLELDHVGA